MRTRNTCLLIWPVYKLIGLFLLLFVLLSACDDNDQPAPDNDYLNKDEVEIIQLITAPISASYAIIETTDTSIVVKEAERLGFDAMKINQQVINEEILNNKKAWNIPKEDFRNGQVWISEEEYLNKTFKVLSEEYGVVGVFHFSRPYIFNDTMAIFETSQFCGPLCGNGLITVAKKENGVWVKRADNVTWVSK